MSEITEEIMGVRAIHDGSTAGRLEFQLQNGGKAVVSASFEPADEPAADEKDVKPKEQEAETTEVDPDADTVPLKGKLPEGFPGYAALDAAGIHTYAQVRKVDDLTTIDGIGAATAAKIEEALGEEAE